jgi:hypothetical protein
MYGTIHNKNATLCSMAGTYEDSLSRDEAIKILNTWGSRGFFRAKNLGN